MPGIIAQWILSRERDESICAFSRNFHKSNSISRFLTVRHLEIFLYLKRKKIISTPVNRLLKVFFFGNFCRTIWCHCLFHSKVKLEKNLITSTGKLCHGKIDEWEERCRYLDGGDFIFNISNFSHQRSALFARSHCQINNFERGGVAERRGDSRAIKSSTHNVRCSVSYTECCRASHASRVQLAFALMATMKYRNNPKLRRWIERIGLRFFNGAVEHQARFMMVHSVVSFPWRSVYVCN